MPDTLDSFQEQQRRSIRDLANRGAILTVLQSLASRALIFVSQLVLGWVLSPEDFGKSALAAAITNFVWMFLGLGIDDVLRQRGNSIKYWERDISLIVVCQGVVLAGILLAGSPVAAWLFDVPEMEKILSLSAISIFISSFSVTSAARVSVELDFKFIAKIELANVVLYNVLAVFFAFTGAGVYAFFLPLPISALFKSAAYLKRAPLEFNGVLNMRRLDAIFVRGASVTLTRFLNSVIQQGDYFVLGLFVSVESVGIYAFAFKIAGTPMRVIATSLQGVLLPTIALMKSDPGMQRDKSLEAAEMIAHVVFPMCALQAAMAGPVLDTIFEGKWNAALMPIYYLSFGFGAEAVYSTARTFLVASGDYSRLLRFTIVQTVIFLVTVTIGASLGGVNGVAAAVCLYFLIVLPAFFLRVFQYGTGIWCDLWRVFGLPGLLSVMSTLFYMMLAGTFVPVNGILAIVTPVIVLPCIYIILIRYVREEIFRRSRQLISTIFIRENLY